VKREEQQFLEAQSTPLRNYLMQNVMPTMSQGLIECCRVRPNDPVDFLVLSPHNYTSNPLQGKLDTDVCIKLAPVNAGDCRFGGPDPTWNN